MAEVTVTRVSNWMFFLGLLLLLMGVYGFARILHVQVRSVPYPSAGVYPPTFLTPGNNNVFYTRESECEPYPQVYYDFDSTGKQTPREANEQELMVAEQTMSRCIAGFEEDRAKQKQRDKNQAAFLSFVGLGLILSRRFLD